MVLSEAEDTSLKQLIRKRSSIKGRLTVFKDYLAVISQIPTTDLQKADVKELSLRLQKLESLFSDFDALQIEIEVLSNDEEQSKERYSIENRFYSLISSAQIIIESSNQGDDIFVNAKKTSQHGSECSYQPNNHIQLPIIKLPTFNGDYLKWLEFRDTFDSLINQNESIPDINKFHYLKSSLQDSALVAVKSIEVTSVNYKVAWQLLKDRYNNEKILINNHLKSLFSIEPLSRESHKAIRFLVDHISKNLRSLETLGQHTDHWDVLIIYLFSNKLDSVTGRKWEEHKNNFTNLPTLNDFILFLRNRADILETMHTNKSEKNNHQNNNSFHKSSRALVTSSFANKTMKCSLCSESHRIMECSKFKDLTIEDRLIEATRLKLCKNCLRKGHSTQQCKLGPCRFCNKRHNSSLHLNKLDESQTQNINDNKCLHSLPASSSASTTNQVILCSFFMCGSEH
ncbi:unnamed protein product [Plutella xylostella]|uniref:(diamondback moth) hypothetical protein n=1 Tax=Plutella xylostella TaxID=51655 RepID=A0A8S4G9T1_PLUXY|nr:unnamed protein product [Plutella xylostella]